MIVDFDSYRTIEELIQAIEAINKDSVQLLIGQRYHSELIRVFQALPRWSRRISLMGNSLNTISSAVLTQALCELPPNLRGLNLSNNNLGDKSSAELAQIFRALPRELVFVDLENNNFDKKTSLALARAFKELPPNMSELKLACEILNKKNGAQLSQLFATLPLSLRSIGFKFTEDYLDAWIKAGDPDGIKLRNQLAVILPSHIETIKFEGNPVTCKDIRRQILYDQIRMIDNKLNSLRGRGYDEASQVALRLKGKLEDINARYTDDAIDYESVKIEVSDAIDEARPELEKHRIWKTILEHLLLFVLGLGIFYIAACAYHGKFFKAKTNSSYMLDEMQSNIDPLNTQS